MATDIEKIRDQLIQFVKGSRSEAFVEQLGVIVDKAFPEDDVMHDLVIAAASYRSTGGEFLYDEESFLKIAERTLRYLDYLSKQK